MVNNKVLIHILMLFLIAGCVLPIPHKRLHVFGVKSKVVDNETSTPIDDALIYSSDEKEFVKSDKSGRFVLPPIFGWHGGYFIGPISLSLWPGFDIPEPERDVIIRAPGYDDKRLVIKSYEFPINDFIVPEEIRIDK